MSYDEERESIQVSIKAKSAKAWLVEDKWGHEAWCALLPMRHRSLNRRHRRRRLADDTSLVTKEDRAKMMSDYIMNFIHTVLIVGCVLLLYALLGINHYKDTERNPTCPTSSRSCP